MIYVQTAILGVDFLAHYDLSVNMKHRLLADIETNIQFTGIHTKYSSTFIGATTCHSKEYMGILNNSKTITRPFQNTGKIKHDTEHKIKGTGRPVFSRSYRLHPHKYKFVKKEFDKMLREGIISPSICFIFASCA